MAQHRHRPTQINKTQVLPCHTNPTSPDDDLLPFGLPRWSPKVHEWHHTARREHMLLLAHGNEPEQTLVPTTSSDTDIGVYAEIPGTCWTEPGGPAHQTYRLVLHGFGRIVRVGMTDDPDAARLLVPLEGYLPVALVTAIWEQHLDPHWLYRHSLHSSE